MLEPALAAVLEASHAGAGALCLFDQRHELLRLAAEVGLSDDGCKRLRQIRRGGMAGWDMPLHSLLNRRVYLIESAAKNRYVPPLVEAAASVTTIACVPLYAGTTPVASIVLVAVAPERITEQQIGPLSEPLRELARMIEAARRRTATAALPATAPAAPPAAAPLALARPAAERDKSEAARVQTLVTSLAEAERERARLAGARRRHTRTTSSGRWPLPGPPRRHALRRTRRPRAPAPRSPAPRAQSRRSRTRSNARATRSQSCKRARARCSPSAGASSRGWRRPASATWRRAHRLPSWSAGSPRCASNGRPMRPSARRSSSSSGRASWRPRPRRQAGPRRWASGSASVTCWRPSCARPRQASSGRRRSCGPRPSAPPRPPRPTSSAPWPRRARREGIAAERDRLSVALAAVRAERDYFAAEEAAADAAHTRLEEALAREAARRAAGEAPDAATAVPRQPARGPVHVVVVDDDPAWAAASAEGRQVTVVPAGDAALESPGATSPTCVVVNLAAR